MTEDRQTILIFSAYVEMCPRSDGLLLLEIRIKNGAKG